METMSRWETMEEAVDREENNEIQERGTFLKGVIRNPGKFLQDSKAAIGLGLALTLLGGCQGGEKYRAGESIPLPYHEVKTPSPYQARLEKLDRGSGGIELTPRTSERLDINNNFALGSYSIKEGSTLDYLSKEGEINADDLALKTMTDLVESLKQNGYTIRAFVNKISGNEEDDLVDYKKIEDEGAGTIPQPRYKFINLGGEYQLEVNGKEQGASPLSVVKFDDDHDINEEEILAISSELAQIIKTSKSKTDPNGYKVATVYGFEIEDAIKNLEATAATQIHEDYGVGSVIFSIIKEEK